MIMRPLRLAAYLDEAGQDPQAGCGILKSTGISYVALRHAWTSNVCDIPDNSCQILKKLLESNNLDVILIASELGNVPANELQNISKENIHRIFNIATYFKAQYVRIYPGFGNIAQDQILHDWFGLITDYAISANITPLIEISDRSTIFRPSDAIKWLNKYKRWKLLYDPAQLIIKQAQDPYIKYWKPLKQFVAAIDIHDYKIGHGHKPVGFGDAKIDMVLNSDEDFVGWYFLEPALGRKYGTAMTKSGVFEIALNALENSYRRHE